MLHNPFHNLAPFPWLPILALACIPVLSSQAGTLTWGNSATGATTTIGHVKAKGLPSLTGNAINPQIKRKGSNYQVKSDFLVNNDGNGKAKDVSVTVYLSDDAVLDTTKDTKLKTLSLSDYKEGNGKIKAGKGVLLPFKQKVSAVLAQAVNGKYLIGVLESSNQASFATIAIPDSEGNILSSSTIHIVNGTLNGQPVVVQTAPSTLTTITPEQTTLPVVAPVIPPTVPPAGTTVPTVTVKGNQIIIGPIVLPE